MHLRYMAAALRLLVRNDDPTLWEPELILETFALLPKQAVSYQEWLATLGGDLDESMPEDPVEKLKTSGLVDQGIVTIEEAAPAKE